MISELPGNSYCSLLFYCPYYTKVITIKIPKYLADCFLLLPNWGVSFYFGNLLQLTCFLLLPYWGIFLIFKFLLQMTCFLLLFHWGSSPHFQVFAPTDLFPTPALLGDFPSFSSFYSNQLTSYSNSYIKNAK